LPAPGFSTTSRSLSLVLSRRIQRPIHPVASARWPLGGAVRKLFQQFAFFAREPLRRLDP